MAKELPYFQFEPAQWNDGDITLCTLEEQGLFINLCSLYWSKLGVLSYAKVMRRFSGCNASAWRSLIEDGIIEVEDDAIIIGFLDEQFKERKILSDQNRLNALERWKTKRAHSDGITIASSPHTIKKRVEEKKEKKKRVEDNRTSSSKADGLHKLLIDDFCFFYKNVKEVDYSFSGAKDGSAVKAIILKIKKQWKSKHGTPPEIKNIQESFQWLLKNVHKSEWVFNNLSLANLNGKFNEIIQHIKTGNNGRKNYKSGVPELTADQLQDIIEGRS